MTLKERVENANTFLKFVLLLAGILGPCLIIVTIVFLLASGYKIDKVTTGPVEFRPPNAPTGSPIAIIVPENNPGVIIVTPTPKRESENSDESELWGEASQELGVNYYQGQQLNLGQFAEATENQVYVAHGDILGTGRCNIIASDHGEQPSDLGLSRASWKLWLVEGSEEWIASEIDRLQEGAASHAGTDCPRVN